MYVIYSYERTNVPFPNSFLISAFRSEEVVTLLPKLAFMKIRLSYLAQLLLYTKETYGSFPD